MIRETIQPRADLSAKLDERGMIYHEGYYKETAAYRFSSSEIDKLEEATNTLFEMCMKVVQHVIDNGLWNEFFIPKEQADFITRSWNEDDFSLYGRFDLGYNSKTGQIKMLEFNADTPTSLLEAAVIQYDWLQSANKFDQWNSLHERIVSHLRNCREYLSNTLHFACARDSAEDYMTVSYLAECAKQAGYNAVVIYVDEISVRDGGDSFCTPDGMPIASIFKLYPWEWLMNESFANYLGKFYGKTTWIEPPYKAILSNKMLLVYLWKLFPKHPLLLESHFTTLPGGQQTNGDWVTKPIYSREGQNVSISMNGESQQGTDGEYGDEGYVEQRFFRIETFDGWLPVLGAWVIAGEAAGMGIREEHDSLITTNMAQFAPHYFQ